MFYLFKSRNFRCLLGVYRIFKEAKKHLIRIANEIYDKGLTPGKSGNISIKAPKSSNILITPSGISLRDVKLNNIIVTDCNGKQVEGEGKASSELNMHLKIYRTRPDIGGIVHTHSPYATGFSFSDEEIPRFEGFGEIKDLYIKKVDYATPGSYELVELASHALFKEDVIILKNHGVVSVASNLDEAALLAEFTESCAKTGFVMNFLKFK
jgi:L-fuculose-phosphate aldolase